MSVDADRTRLDPARHAVSQAQILRPDSALQSVFGIIRETSHRVQIVIVK